MTLEGARACDSHLAEGPAFLLVGRFLAFIAGACAIGSSCDAEQVVAYAGSGESTTFLTACGLSDGSLLIGGGADSLDWVPGDVPRTLLSADAIRFPARNGRIGFLLHLGRDAREIIQVVHFPPGAVEAIRRIRVSDAPGAAPGSVFFSATVADDFKKGGGYVIASLDGNFVAERPRRLRWLRDVSAGGDTREIQPWDVGSDGKVLYASGKSYGPDWMAVYRLRDDGTDDVVEEWRVHWGMDENGKDTEAQFAPLSSRPGFRATKSGLVMKLWGRGCLRSWTQEDYDLWLPDGNGRLKKGRWPDDYYFKGPFNAAQPTHEGPGYTGYSIALPCPRVGSIVVDRRNNDFYVGFSVQTRLPDGGPDFEPAVVAMTASGGLKWWSRVYHEFLPKDASAKKGDVLRDGDTRTSTPDQYVDHLAVDDAGQTLVVAARCHGNNVINLWSGDAIAARPGAHGFQNRFTGSNGNVHIQWLGKLALADGQLTGRPKGNPMTTVGVPAWGAERPADRSGIVAKLEW